MDECIQTSLMNNVKKALSTPVDIPSRTLVVVIIIIFQVSLPELVQPAPVRVPRIPFAGDGENLLQECLMERRFIRRRRTRHARVVRHERQFVAQEPAPFLARRLG